eukprot:2674939-Rhodomonas_salina.1
MASLSLGPALKAQFTASSKRSTPLGDRCAQDNLCAEPSMDEDEDNHHCYNDIPTGLTLRRTLLSQMTADKRNSAISNDGIVRSTGAVGTRHIMKLIKWLMGRPELIPMFAD